MSKLCSKLAKSAFPIEVEGGGRWHVRMLTFGQKRFASEADSDDGKVWAMLGLMLVDETGSPLIDRPEGESATDFASRVEGDADDFTLYEASLITEAYGKLESRMSDVGRLSKN